VHPYPRKAVAITTLDERQNTRALQITAARFVKCAHHCAHHEQSTGRFPETSCNSGRQSRRVACNISLINPHMNVKFPDFPRTS
jgi:hypothetical protein